MAEPRVLVWDIESTSLNAVFGTILCIGYKWLGKPKVHVPSILDGNNGNMLSDKHLVEEFATVFNTCDYHTTWYGERFDHPMVCSKLIKFGLPPLAPKPHLDLWKTARKRFKLHSNRLQAWEQFLGLENAKTPISFDAWLQAAHGDRKALATVKHHCKKDVLVLEEVFERMKPWLDCEPARGLMTGDHHGCPSCGSHDIERRGFKVAMTRMFQQFVCKGCGRWFRSASAEKVGSPIRSA